MASAAKLRCPLDRTLPMDWVVLSADIAKGEIRLINNVVCIAAEAGAVGETIAVWIKADRVIVPCLTAATSGYKQGEKVYFDATNKWVTEAAAGGTNKLCAVVLEDSAIGDTEILVSFDGMLGIVS